METSFTAELAPADRLRAVCASAAPTFRPRGKACPAAKRPSGRR